MPEWCLSRNQQLGHQALELSAGQPHIALSAAGPGPQTERDGRRGVPAQEKAAVTRAPLPGSNIWVAAYPVAQVTIAMV